MEISAASESDVEEASECIASAFKTDQLMEFFFPGPVGDRWPLIVEMFAHLLSVRVALGMPALLLRQRGRIAGGVMGYDTRSVEWPPSNQDRWALFEKKRPDMTDRFEAYEAVSKNFKPQVPYYYLGVLGVAPSIQRQGAGAALVDAYCSASKADIASTGVYLETGNPANLPFYRRCGFDLLGRGELDHHTSLWCLFRPNSNA